MDSRTQLIIQMRKDRYSIAEIASKIGTTRQRIYQILAKDLSPEEYQNVVKGRNLANLDT